MALIASQIFLLSVEHDAKRPKCQFLPVRIGLVERDAESRRHSKERIAGQRPVAIDDGLAKRLDGSIWAVEFVGRDLRSAQWRDLTRGVGRFDKTAAELNEKPFDFVGRDRHCPLRHSGEGDIAQQRKRLGEHLCVGKDVGS